MWWPSRICVVSAALPYTVAAVARFGHAVVSCTALVQLARVAQRQSTCLVIRR